MKIRNLSGGSSMYTSNVYLVTGTHNAMKDVNTLIDVGRDPFIIEKINNASTGVGKHRVEQVVLTHNHYDHASLLSLISENYHPAVYAFSKTIKGVVHCLKDGETLPAGDRVFETIYTPGHSNDSICLYCKEDKILFSGDTPLIIQSSGGSYEKGFISALEKLADREIVGIYPGHGSPIVENCNKYIRASLKIVKNQQVNHTKQEIGKESRMVDL